MADTMMRLIEIFLPLADSDGNRFSQSEYDKVEHELTEKFGGVTAYPRAPASGVWKTGQSGKQEDELIIYEVMAKDLDGQWWTNYREKLEKQFRQKELVLRAHAIDRL
jgi:hypothetical protein